jgi:hypothetical protein
MPSHLLFQPLEFRNLTVKNRIFRSNVAGRFDNHDGSGTQTRINWELRFARGGAIISSFVAVHIRGRVLPNYATIDRDERIPFWRELGKRVHDEDCKLSYSSAIRRERLLWRGSDGFEVASAGFILVKSSKIRIGGFLPKPGECFE